MDYVLHKLVPYFCLVAFGILTLAGVQQVLELFEPTISGRKREIEEYLIPVAVLSMGLGGLFVLIGYFLNNGFIAALLFPLWAVAIIIGVWLLISLNVYLGLACTLIASVILWKEFHPRKKSRSKTYLANLLK